MSSGLYIHIPYCIKKCPYCDFNSYARTKEQVATSESSYISALTTEAKEQHWEQEIDSVFIGGGTPSMLSEKSIANLLSEINKVFKLKQNCEITIEANPGSIYEPLNKAKLKSFKASGVNRVSLGCQSFNNQKLKFLGRVHSSEQSIQAIENVKNSGFDNYNLDLIYGIEGEDLASWLKDLNTAIDLEPKHISAYTLTIEPGTEFGRLYKKGTRLTGEDSLVARCYQETQHILAANGFAQYEISNYSKPTFECKHNLSYWSYHNYLGLGAGAHSFKDNQRWINQLNPEKYEEQIKKQKHARQREETLTVEQKQIEIIYSCLRKVAGLNLDHINLNKEILEEIESLIKQDLISKHQNVIKYTKRGFLFSDFVVERLCEKVSS